MRRNDLSATPLRLRDGCHLFPLPGGVWALYGPGDELLRVQAEPAAVERVLAVLGAPVPPSEALADDSEALALLGRFAERDLLIPREREPDGGLSGCRVHVDGDGPVAREVAALLAKAGVEAPDAPHGETDLVVACAGWLPDARFRALDAWCSERRIPWHSCYAEGDRFYLGPIALPGKTASYEDARARRLAASPCPHELEAFWRWLDSKNAPAVPWPGPAAVAALAGTLAADVLAVLGGFPPPSAGYQIGFEPATFTWRRHPVLPVPRILSAAP